MNSKEIGRVKTLLAWNYGPQHQHINHFTAQVEAKAHAEQQAGLDREALKRQEVSLIEQRKKNQTKVGEVQQRRDNQECNGTNGMGCERWWDEVGLFSFDNWHMGFGLFS